MLIFKIIVKLKIKVMRKIIIIFALISIVISTFSQERRYSVLIDTKEVETALNLGDSILLSASEIYFSCNNDFSRKINFLEFVLENKSTNKIFPKKIALTIAAKTRISKSSRMLITVFVNNPNSNTERLYLGDVPGKIVRKDGFFWFSPV